MMIPEKCISMASRRLCIAGGAALQMEFTEAFFIFRWVASSSFRVDGMHSDRSLQVFIFILPLRS
jgi:hypothetical protein